MEDKAENSPAKIIVIAGPTAVGKSDLALELARKVGGEIISADAVQVYKGFDIGSAKPIHEVRAALPHHLIDVVEAPSQWNAGDFARSAAAVVADLQKRGKVPIIVAASGLYLNALLYGLAELPQADLRLRAELDQLSLEELGSKLLQLDPVSAAKIHANDRLRLSRAIESALLAGEAASQAYSRHRQRTPCYQALIVICQRERKDLYERINQRVRDFLAQGLVAEVEGLLKSGVPADSAPFSAIGYRETLKFVQDGSGGPLNLLEGEIATSTRQFAKRQLTYLRNEPKKSGWQSMGTLQSEAAVERAVREFLAVEDSIQGKICFLEYMLTHSFGMDFWE